MFDMFKSKNKKLLEMLEQDIARAKRFGKEIEYLICETIDKEHKSFAKSSNAVSPAKQHEFTLLSLKKMGEKYDKINSVGIRTSRDVCELHASQISGDYYGCLCYGDPGIWKKANAMYMAFVSASLNRELDAFSLGKLEGMRASLDESLYE